MRRSLLSAGAAAAPSPLAAFVASARRLLVITGAGVSTDSGIPDYRSPQRPAYKPLQHHEFVASERVRRRYWARSFVGFRTMRDARPNAAHAALAALERLGLAPAGLITQNVDRLHQRAGHADVLELHGTVHECECMACRATTAREAVQAEMAAANARWAGLAHREPGAPALTSLTAVSEELGMIPPAANAGAKAGLRPDGDVELADDSVYESFALPHCGSCGAALLKPMVTFHGGSVPPAVTADAAARARGCDAVLVAGSTLSTFSAFRLVRDAAARGAPVAIVNCGATRADALAALKLEERLGIVLPELVAAVSDGSGLRSRRAT
jgi:NAD-dependent deacetylase sirtuin 4